ncbi:dendritic arbor reduction protein 1 [Drosophila novamexicana]|uniref:dendritic arbor reduction protein 1 n=1 Tax=Drosophila novamexicana TaxID=47314 RepID=UPI0011E5E407|nr:dendritic arbor reduction protein 1 [Drosophila novamexicana]
MFPQAELENYKLQVELLQEKLRRSEDNRQQLEHKLDKVLQKRSELEKCVRQKSRQKYQEFLEEQSKRNERNKKLVQMLERIDEQTALMSQRSERLKMMKLQYQMYFAKLVQNQTLRCIQQTTTTGGTPLSIPVLIQPQAAAVSNPTATTDASAQAPAPNQNQKQPLLIPLTAASPQQWAFAMATPTPTQTGMLLATQAMPQPIYMPYPDLYGGAGAGAGAGAGVSGGQTLGTSNLFDLRATLRALDNENADLPERMTHFDVAALSATESQYGNADRAAPTETTATTTTTTMSTPCSPKDMSARELSSTSSTLATSSLTFDKLPKTAALTELPAAAVAGNDDVDDRPQEAAQLCRESQPGLEQKAWPNSRVTRGEHEISPSVAGYNEPRRQPQQQYQERRQHDLDAYFGELKIDEPWHPTTAPAATIARPMDQFEDKMELSVRPSEMNTVGGGGAIGGLVGGISNDLLDEVKASRAVLEQAAAAVDEQLARGNQLSPLATNEPFAKPRVSIENIENAIYGERLTGTTTAISARAAAEAAAAATAVAAAAAAPAPKQGLFENLATNASQAQQQQQHQQNQGEQHEGEQMSAVEVEKLQEQQQQQRLTPTHDGAQIDYGQYDDNSYMEPGEPSYASIETTQQQQLPQPASVTGEPLYSEIGNPADYQQYVADANAASEAEAEAATAAAQQEYSNMDYSNYDAAQYTAGYDPNAYPGYIYDEATGQYIADPNAEQYAPDGSYAGQDYDVAATNYDYYGEQQLQQQPQQEVQQEAAYPMSDNNSAAAELVLPQEVEQAPSFGGNDAKTEATHSPVAPDTIAKPVKPTSILASTDKQATPNDTHQQQQQQKKKKRVNFVDSSETDDSSSAKPAQEPTAPTATPNIGAPAGAATAASGAGSESDFDFSTGSEAKN